MTEIEQGLWARVYAAEYDRLAAREKACFEPEPSSRHPHRKADWNYGCAPPGNEMERTAADRADRAVKLFRERAKCDESS